MNNNDFYNGGQPQNNMNPGMPGMQPQNNMNPGMPGMQPQNNMNPGMPGMQPQNNMNPGMPGMQPQYNQYPGMVGPQPKKPMNKGLIIGIVAAVAVVVIVIILFATGVFGGKTLTCTKSETESGMTMKEELKIKFKDDKMDKITSKATIVYGEGAEMYKSYMDAALQMSVEEYKEQGIKAEVKTSDNSSTLILTFDKEQAIEEYYLEEDELTYDAIKGSLEESDYTCK